MSLRKKNKFPILSHSFKLLKISIPAPYCRSFLMNIIYILELSLNEKPKKIRM